ncbi:MAG: SO_0444 family Cu/Zn efflux transporter [Candidatus Hydrogenedentes bacterium]|nr:SO_0444 family Cu/Zn efflux transporter [Candidatus Hydrogenedentota bacterium]
MIVFEYIEETILEMWGVTAEMAPYLLFGFLVAGFISVFLSPEWIERHMGGRGLGPVWQAVLFGIPLPLCSCSVIPVTASLRTHGASRGAATGFLLATPQTGVDSIVATWGMLGPVFAVFRALAALVTGVVGGGVVSVIEPEPERSGQADTRSEDKACAESCCATKGMEPRWKRGLRYAFLTLPQDIGKPLALGILAAGLIAAFVPPDMFVEYLGGGLLAMVVMMVVGIPIYVCATASIPLAIGFIHLGASPGAALAFLVAGPATNAATLATVFKVLGKRTAAVYLLTVALGALAAGFGLDATIGLLGRYGLPGAHMTHDTPLAWWQHASAVMLIAVIGASMWRGWPRKPARAGSETVTATTAKEPPEGNAITLTINGMTCEHCTKTVARGLRNAPGVTSAEVDLTGRPATVRGQNLDIATLRQIVRDLGYDVSS